MIKVQQIHENDLESVCILASECFADDSFYRKLSENRNKRIEKLKAIFRISIRICMEHGYAYGIIEEGIFVSFALWFNYDELKRFYPDKYNHIFIGDKLSRKINKSLSKETKEIDALINNSTEYLYLLAIGVKNEYRGKGYASKMVMIMKEAFPHFNLFSDISNDSSINIYKKLGFDVVRESEGCTFVRYRSTQRETEPTKDEQSNIWLAIPLNQNTDDLGINVIVEETGLLKYVQVTDDTDLYFSLSLYEQSEVRLIQISFCSLAKYQRYINVTLFDEIKFELNGKTVVAYVTKKQSFPGLKGYTLKSEPYVHKREWDIIPDVYTSIPIQYTCPKKLNASNEESFLVSRILKSLDFRTTYEAGIPIKSLDNRKFKYRIKRFYLGRIQIQILEEKSVLFDGQENGNIPNGSPIEVELIASVDTETKCGVVHLVSLSCGLLITHYLDSVSRNQINVVSEGTNINMFNYLQNKFGIEAKGTPKNFLTITDDRENIKDDLLASMLFCETLYEDGIAIGKVIDKDITRILSDNNGNAQYNYATVYTYKNILIQMSKSFQGGLYERIVMETITLFYIELILFEVSAIEIANDSIIGFLGSIDKHQPKDVLKNINNILSEHVKSIDFWNIQMNYPSSKKSIDDIRKDFNIDEERAVFQRNKEELLMIYDTRSDIVDKSEAKLISFIAAIFTIISISSLLINPQGQSQWLLIKIIGLILAASLIAISAYRWYLHKNIFYKETYIRRFINRRRK